MAMNPTIKVLLRMTIFSLPGTFHKKFRRLHRNGADRSNRYRSIARCIYKEPRSNIDTLDQFKKTPKTHGTSQSAAEFSQDLVSVRIGQFGIPVFAGPISYRFRNMMIQLTPGSHSKYSIRQIMRKRSNSEICSA